MSRLRVLARTTSLVLVGLSLGAGRSDAQAHSLAAASWFEGCWERSNGVRRTIERWYAPVDGSMRGTSRSFNDTTETAGERLRVFVADGKLVYAAHPSTQPSQEFRATTVTATEIVFENPAHDFPQRIVYVRQGADSLIARIEGDRAGRRQPVTFAFRKRDCAGQGDSPVDAAQAELRPRYSDLESKLRAHPQALSTWFVANAAPEFSYLNFAGSGYQARRGSLATQEAAARTVASSTPPTLTEYTVSIAIASMLVRGDTAEVMAVTSQSAKVGPATGAATRRTESRRLDRWVRRGGEWKLLTATLVGDEQTVDGKLIYRDGVPLP